MVESSSETSEKSAPPALTLRRDDSTSARSTLATRLRDAPTSAASDFGVGTSPRSMSALNW